MKKKQYFEITMSYGELIDLITNYIKTNQGLNVSKIDFVIGDNPEQSNLPYPTQIVKEILIKGEL